jgi:hypothetical protein
VATPLNHFRRHILSTPTEAIGNISALKSKFAQPEIGDLDVPINPNQQILRFEVSIHHSLLMQIHQSIKYFYKVESSVLLLHAFTGTEQKEKFTAWAI